MDQENEYLDEVNFLTENDRMFEAWDVMQKWIAEKGETEVMAYQV